MLIKLRLERDISRVPFFCGPEAQCHSSLLHLCGRSARPGGCGSKQTQDTGVFRQKDTCRADQVTRGGLTVVLGLLVIFRVRRSLRNRPPKGLGRGG